MIVYAVWTGFAIFATLVVVAMLLNTPLERCDKLEERAEKREQKKARKLKQKLDKQWKLQQRISWDKFWRRIDAG